MTQTWPFDWSPPAPHWHPAADLLTESPRDDETSLWRVLAQELWRLLAARCGCHCILCYYGTHCGGCAGMARH